MISTKILHRAESTRTSHYYGDQEDDYYHSDGTAAQWQGKGAQTLGLTGEVTQQQLQRMLRGDLGPGKTLAKSVRLDSRARAGIDVTFSAPKSVTLQALLAKDPRVIQAHDKAVADALENIEQTMAIARQKVDGQVLKEATGNLIIAKFRHETARPTPDAPPDPQLHTHALIMNLTQRADGTWATLSNESIVQFQRLINAHYMSSLARELEMAGYEVRYEKEHIELAHVSREQIEAFSHRRLAVDAKLAEQGLERQSASHGQKQTATLATRLPKSDSYTREQLEQVWQQRARGVGFDMLATPKSPRTRQLSESQASARRDYVATQALRWAIKHHTEREAVVSESKLLMSATTHSRGLCDMQDLHAELKRLLSAGDVHPTVQMYRGKDNTALILGSREELAQRMAEDEGINMVDAGAVVDAAISTGFLVPTEPHYTTTAALDCEAEMLAIEARGRNALERVIPDDAMLETLAALPLKQGQREAVELILTSKHRFVGVQGLAGTGKSHMLKSMKGVAEDAGHKIIAVAPYSSQARALKGLGIPASTVASRLEGDPKRFARMLDAKTIVLIDEAGVIPGRQMRKLMQTIEKHGARAVMLGDTAQTKAIEATPAFQQLQAAGLATAGMNEIVRQSNEKLRAAVTLAAKGKAEESLGLIDKVHTIEDSDKRYETIATRYSSLPEDERNATLILTGTNLSRNAINDAVHSQLGLDGKGHMYTLLTRRDSTQAERRYARYYSVGDIIQPERDYRSGLKRGKLYRIIGRTGTNQLEVKSLDSEETIRISPGMARKLSVYQPVRAELSSGDIVRITRNDTDLDIANGDRAQVMQVSPHAVTLKIGERELTFAADAPLHMDRAYATTAHSAQGLTSEKVIINLETKSRTTKRDIYYVDISRARSDAVIYTDSLKELPKSVQRREEKTIALDVVQPNSYQAPDFSREIGMSS